MPSAAGGKGWEQGVWPPHLLPQPHANVVVRLNSMCAGFDTAGDGCEVPSCSSRGGPAQRVSAPAVPHWQESVNPAVFEVESGSLSFLRLPGNCQPCREMAVLFWKLALLPLQLLEMNLLFPQLQISTSSIAASAPSAAPAQRAHCSSLAR